MTRRELGLVAPALSPGETRQIEVALGDARNCLDSLPPRHVAEGELARRLVDVDVAIDDEEVLELLSATPPVANRASRCPRGQRLFIPLLPDAGLSEAPVRHGSVLDPAEPAFRPQERQELRRPH